jgi:hypothetical protein
MPTLSEVYASLASWEQPPGGDNPFKLSCRLDPGASVDEIAEGAPSALESEDLRALWSTSRESWLFEDTEYGQWGLHVLRPADSAARTSAERAQRSDDLRPDDVVVGEFLGDAELLVYAPSEVGGRRYLIALPLDPREGWFAAGASSVEVLERLLDANGDKYWERSST